METKIKHLMYYHEFVNQQLRIQEAKELEETLGLAEDVEEKYSDEQEENKTTGSEFEDE